MLIEVCVQNLEDALRAEQEGADRIELCASLETGGITPSGGLIAETVRRLKIPVHVLIRPRVGDFCYTAKELEILLADIRMAIEWGAKGIVTGVLDQDENLDIVQMEDIRANTQGRHLTFHRAFDLVADPFQTLDQLESIGVDTVLTSGQRQSASEAISLLLELKERSQRVTIMPGGGVRTNNIRQFKDAGFHAIHFSGTSSRPVEKEVNSGKHFSVSELGSSSRLIMQTKVIREMIRSVK